MTLTQVFSHLQTLGYDVYTLTENAIKGDHEVTLYTTTKVIKFKSPTSVRYASFDNLHLLTL